MDAKKYLSQAHTIDMRINSKMDLLNDWISLYQRTLRIKSSIHTSYMREPDSMTGVLSQLEDSAETTLQEVNTLAATKASISAAIDGVEDELLRLILEKRYLQKETWEDIAHELGYDIRHIYRLHDKALKQVKIPNMSPNVTINGQQHVI